MFVVIRHFTDLHDADHKYVEGDVFPREGIKVSRKRIVELASSDNKQGVPLIAEVLEEAPAEEPAKEKAEAKKPAGKKKSSAK